MFNFCISPQREPLATIELQLSVIQYVVIGHMSHYYESLQLVKCSIMNNDWISWLDLINPIPWFHLIIFIICFELISFSPWYDLIKYYLFIGFN